MGGNVISFVVIRSNRFPRQFKTMTFNNSSSSMVFATLSPSNPLAKSAFSAVYVHNSAAHYQYRARVEPKQIFDKEVKQLRIQQRRQNFSDDLEDTVTEDSTEPDTETEDEQRSFGMIWKGHYSFNLNFRPHEPATGWRAGKGRNDMEMDFLLTTKLDAEIKGYHVMFKR